MQTLAVVLPESGRRGIHNQGWTCMTHQPRVLLTLSGDNAAHDDGLHLPPGFVTVVFRSMPTVWRGRHRLIFCWLVFMQAVHPGRHTLEEMARWTPAMITAWRFGRLLKASLLERCICSSVGWRRISWPPCRHPPMACCICLAIWSRRQTRYQESCGAERAHQPASSLVFGLRFVLLMAAWDSYRLSQWA